MSVTFCILFSPEVDWTQQPFTTELMVKFVLKPVYAVYLSQPLQNLKNIPISNVGL